MWEMEAPMQFSVGALATFSAGTRVRRRGYKQKDWTIRAAAAHLDS